MQAKCPITYEAPLKQVILYFSGELYSESDIGGNVLLFALSVFTAKLQIGVRSSQVRPCPPRGSDITNYPQNVQGDRIFSAQNRYVKSTSVVGTCIEIPSTRATQNPRSVNVI